eukprot:gene9206-11282_t
MVEQKRNASFLKDVINNFKQLANENPKFQELLAEFKKLVPYFSQPSQMSEEEIKLREEMVKKQEEMMKERDKFKKQMNEFEQTIDRREAVEDLVSRDAVQYDNHHLDPKWEEDIQVTPEVLKYIQGVKESKSGKRPPASRQFKEPTYEGCTDYYELVSTRSKIEEVIQPWDPRYLNTKHVNELDHYKDQAIIENGIVENFKKIILEKEDQVRFEHMQETGSELPSIDWEDVLTIEDLRKLPKPFLKPLADAVYDPNDLKRDDPTVYTQLGVVETVNKKKAAEIAEKERLLNLERAPFLPVQSGEKADTSASAQYDKLVMKFISPFVKFFGYFGFGTTRFINSSYTEFILENIEFFAPGFDFPKFQTEVELLFIPYFVKIFFAGDKQALKSYTSDKGSCLVGDRLLELEGIYRVLDSQVLEIDNIDFMAVIPTFNGSSFRFILEVTHTLEFKDYAGKPVQILNKFINQDDFIYIDEIKRLDDLAKKRREGLKDTDELPEEEEEDILEPKMPEGQYLTPIILDISMDLDKNKFGWVVDNMHMKNPFKRYEYGKKKKH